ncbi:unnamed protein product [Adineta steineri]|uniref:Uncharacterized protein n=1 Tax=Adineta steineri TaxID=433720 RepID=A0A819NJW6_9BILA|nr:unnamed protein product [Adineta steineri]
MNLQSNEKPIFINNDLSMCFNDKQSNNLLSPNIESRINPTANYSVDFNSINELIDLHKKRKRTQTIINGQQPVLWRLDGEQWARYLNYIYGPNRIWTERSSSSSFFCCRRSTYERLMNRQHGHIILHEKGLIIDELYFVSFRDYTLQDVKILYIDANSKIIGLRIHTYFQDGKYNHYCYYDLFAPSSVSLEQIQTLARAYIIKISGISVLDLPFEIIHLPE